MRRNKIIDKAHRALRYCCERENAEHLLYLVNLTKLEREIVLRYELDGEPIEYISCTLQEWHHTRLCSYIHCFNIKQQALRKIGMFLTKKRKVIDKQQLVFDSFDII
jgi:hypothetical protein